MIEFGMELFDTKVVVLDLYIMFWGVLNLLIRLFYSQSSSRCQLEPLRLNLSITKMSHPSI